MKNTMRKLMRILAVVAVAPLGASVTFTASHAGGGGGGGGGAGGGGSYGLGGTEAGGGPIGAGCCDAAVTAARRAAAATGGGADRGPDPRFAAQDYGHGAGRRSVHVPRACTRLRRLAGRCRRYHR